MSDTKTVKPATLRKAKEGNAAAVMKLKEELLSGAILENPLWDWSNAYDALWNAHKSFLEALNLMLQTHAEELAGLPHCDPLAHAAFYGWTETTERLLQAGADPNTLDSGLLFTPLCRAVLGTNSCGGSANYAEKTIRLLLEAGALPQIEGACGPTPRSMAECGGLTDIARLLKDAESTTGQVNINCLPRGVVH